MIATVVLLLAQPAAEAAGVAAAPSTFIVSNPCEERDVFARYMCAQRSLEKLETELADELGKASALMRALDQRVAREYEQQFGHLENLQEGQQAWLAFREQQCRGETALHYGGMPISGHFRIALETECKARMTEQRIGQLRDLAARVELED